MMSFLRRLFVVSLVVMIIGFLLPQHFTMPVKGADRRSYDQRSYWHYPWGKSVTHKGVDIFAKAGTPVLSACEGIVVFTGKLGRGGNVVLVLGAGWKFHYYAHLRDINTGIGSWLSLGEPLGTVGNTGNAAGKPSHLHYTIRNVFPHPQNNTDGPHGGRRMWFTDPTPLLNAVTAR